MNVVGWLEEDARRTMVISHKTTLHKLRAKYPHIKHQMLPMPSKGHGGAFNTRLFIERVDEADRQFIKEEGPLTNDEIKVMLGRPVIIEIEP